MPKRKTSETTQVIPQSPTSQGSVPLDSTPKPSYTLGQAVMFVAVFQRKNEHEKLPAEERYTLLGRISGALLAVKQGDADTAQKPVLKWFYTIVVEDISNEGNIQYQKFIVHEDNIHAL